MIEAEGLGMRYQTGRLALEGGPHQQLHPRQGVAHLVRDAGGQLADGRQLLRPKQFALLLLQARDRLAHPGQHVVQLPVEVLAVALPGHPNRPQLLGEVGVRVLQPDAQARDRPTQSPGNPEAADQAAQGPQEPQQEKEAPALVADLLALLGGRLHPLAVDAEQLLARPQQRGDRVSIDPT